MESVFEKRIEELKRRVEDENLVWIIKNRNNVEPILQQGPQCGVVALCMAVKALGLEIQVENVMNMAREMKFTKQGELFDIEYLFKLTTIFYGDKCQLVDLGDSSPEATLAESLLDSKMVLIAYDCDFNFEPCFKRGTKAHWALVTGIIIPAETDGSAAENRLYFDQSSELDVSTKEKLLRNLAQTGSKALELTCVICKHGKSRHHGVWNLKRLVASNKQLRDIDEDKCDRSLFIHPQGDLSKTLANKIIVLR